MALSSFTATVPETKEVEFSTSLDDVMRKFDTLLRPNDVTANILRMIDASLRNKIISRPDGHRVAIVVLHPLNFDDVSMFHEIEVGYHFCTPAIST